MKINIRNKLLNWWDEKTSESSLAKLIKKNKKDDKKLNAILSNKAHPPLWMADWRTLGIVLGLVALLFVLSHFSAILSWSNFDFKAATFNVWLS